MPIIPKRQGPAIDPAPVQRPGVQGGAPRGSFGEGTDRVAAASLGILRQVSRIGQESAQRKATARSEFEKFQAEARQKAREMDFQDKKLTILKAKTRQEVDIKGRTGRDALTGLNQASEDWQKTVSEVLKDVKDPETRAAVEFFAREQGQNLSRAAQFHALNERQKLDKDQNESLRQIYRDQGSLNYNDPAIWVGALEDGIAEIESYHRRIGSKKAIKDADIQQYESGFHKDMLTRMISDGQIEMAQDHEGEHKDKILNRDLKVLAAVRSQAEEAEKEAYDQKQLNWFLRTLPEGLRPNGLPPIDLSEAASLLASGEMKEGDFKSIETRLTSKKTVDPVKESEALFEIMDGWQEMGGTVGASGLPSESIEVDRGFFTKDLTMEQVQKFRNLVVSKGDTLSPTIQKRFLLYSQRALLESSPAQKSAFSSVLNLIKSFNTGAVGSTMTLLDEAFEIFDEGKTVEQVEKKATEVKEKIKIANNPNRSRYQVGQIVKNSQGLRAKVIGFDDLGNPQFEALP